MRKIVYIIVGFVFLLGLFACEKGAGSADYGFAYIYMPQATVSGGLNNNYYVPSGDGVYTYNFKIDSVNNNLLILLGVLRSGDLPNKAYSVSVVAQTDTTKSILYDGLIENGMLFPSWMYSLPARVDVPGDKSGASFYMTVPIEELKDNVYTDKKLVLTVGIDYLENNIEINTMPLEYELSATNTSTVVILDVDAIRAFLP